LFRLKLKLSGKPYIGNSMEVLPLIRPVKCSQPPPPRSHLFQFSDGSILRKMQAKDLIKLEVWQGNRFLDNEHKQDIIKSLKDSLQSLDLKPYHVVTYVEDQEDGEQKQHKTVLVDGQHRASILRDTFYQNQQPVDFDVLVVEKICKNESEVIQYFKILNKTKAIPWNEDLNLVVNRYIKALEKKFNTNKKQLLIRPVATRKPYLSVEKLRDELKKRRIGKSDTDRTPEEFAEYAWECNESWLLSHKDSNEKSIQACLAVGFALAFDDKFSWIQDFI
jgi:hypothetical protein